MLFYFFMTLNFCVVTCQERTVSLFLFWRLLTRVCVLVRVRTLFSKTAKKRKKENNPQSRAILSSVSKLFFQMREGKAAGISACVALLVTGVAAK